MYPLKAILVGCDESEHPELHHELDNLGVVIEATFGDVPAAIHGLNTSADEKLLFVTVLNSASQVRLLEKLNDAFVGRPILALLKGVMDPALVIEAMRAGAVQVVGLPFQADDLHRALERIARQFGYSGAASRVIAVTGVTEGCGATTLAINLGAEIARLAQARTILAELSLRMGRVATFLDIEPRFTTHDLISDPERMDIDVVRQALTEVAEQFAVLAGPYKGISALKPATPHVIRLVDYTRRLAQVVVLDMPYTFDEVYFGTIALADQVVIVGEQNIPAVRALKTVRETLQKVEGIGTQYLVINRYDSSLHEFSRKHMEELLGVPRIYTVANDWTNFARALNNGRLLRAENPHAPALADIDTLARTLLGIQEAEHRHWHLPRFLRKLVAPA